MWSKISVTLGAVKLATLPLRWGTLVRKMRKRSMSHRVFARTIGVRSI